jgi:hypothetical protein
VAAGAVSLPPTVIDPPAAGGSPAANHLRPGRSWALGPVRWAMIAVLLAAAALRVWRLGVVPPGFQFDEAYNAIDAARVLAGPAGHLRLFFPDNGGREPLYTYLQAAALAVLDRGNVVAALRLVSAAAGVAAVALVYACAARILGRRDVAVLAAGFLAASTWHVHFSRYGIRAVLAPMWAAAVIWAWWLAVGAVGAPAPERAPNGRRSLVAAMACGVLLALAVYSHPSGRLLPLVLAAHAVYRTAAYPERARRTWRAFCVAGLTALACFAPLGLYFLHHPAEFTAHPSDVSLAAVAAAEHGGSLARALGANLAAVAGMFFVAGDPSTLHNVPGQPVFDPLSATFFLVGTGALLGLALLRRGAWRDRAALLAGWLVVGLLPTALSDRPPNFSRAAAALPAIVMLPALGVGWSLDAAKRWPPAARASAAALVLAACGLWTGYRYLDLFPRNPAVFYSYDVDKVEAYRALRPLAAQANVFLHPVWADQATFAFLNVDGAISSMDGHDTLVLAADGRDSVVAFAESAAERQEWYDKAKSLYGSAAARTRITDTMGATLLRLLWVKRSAAGDLRPPHDAPLEPEVFDDVVFDGRIRLVGHTLGRVVPGAPMDVVLVWQALAPVEDDLTVFVHLVGSRGEDLGQEDREPAHASYRTSRWTPGDVVIDRYRPEVSPSAEGSLTVEVGWYNRQSGRRLTADRVATASDSVALQAVPVEAQADK